MLERCINCSLRDYCNYYGYNSNHKYTYYDEDMKNRYYRDVPEDLKPNIKERFSTEEAIEIGRSIGVKFDKFDIEQFRMGLDVELEHGRHDMNTNVTDDDPIMTGKITLAHLNEFPDYYTRLYKMEEEAEDYWGESK